jgi:hypothetical protein
MTIEIRQLIIRAVVEAQPHNQTSAAAATPPGNAAALTDGGSRGFNPLQERQLVERCSRAVLNQLARLKER